MKVIKRSTMPDGTKIQIEDWKNGYTIFKTLSIAAYPVAKADSEYNIIKKNTTFRLDMSTGFTSDEEVNKIFDDLENGKINLIDLSSHFWNGQKDKFLLTGITEV